MKIFVFFILLATLPLLSLADGEHCEKHNEDKKQCQTENCRPQIRSIEEFGFMVPPPTSDKPCQEQRQYHRAIVNFYQWYLNNQYAISAGLSHPYKQRDLLPPFHVSYETLHQFYQLIREKYPDWVSELTPDTPVSPRLLKQKKAPVTNVSTGTVSCANATDKVVDTRSAT